MSASQVERLFREAVPGSGLMVRLETPLAALQAGRGTAVFCSGACFHRSEEVAGVELVLDGVRHRLAAWGMPRLELYQLLHPEIDPRDRGPERDPSSREDPHLRGYRSGFWGTVPAPASKEGGALPLELAVRLAGGRTELAPLGEIAVSAAPMPDAPPAPPGSDPLIAICMATLEPEPALFRAQIDSIRAQDHQRWICLISDDGSSVQRFEMMAEAVRDDTRFVLSRSPGGLGAYRNFERALGMAPAEAELVALCDQDDCWHADKLSTLRDSIGTAQLAYSDLRVVDETGAVLAPTLWSGRRNNHTDLAALLVANSVTGAAALFRRDVADLALPFPEGPGWQFHDHWVALVALATGDMAYVDRPLYDYVQHGSAVTGHGGEPVARRRGPAQWRASYFHGYVAREVQARALLERSPVLAPPKRRALRRFVAAGRRPGALAWLAVRPLRPRSGYATTLGTEWELARGVLWRHLAGRLARRRGTRLGLTLEAACPPISATTLGHGRLARWRARLATGQPAGGPPG